MTTITIIIDSLPGGISINGRAKVSHQYPPSPEELGLAKAIGRYISQELGKENKSITNNVVQYVERDYPTKN